MNNFVLNTFTMIVGINLISFIALGDEPVVPLSMWYAPVVSRCFPEGYAIRAVGSAEAFGHIFGLPENYGRPEHNGHRRNIEYSRLPVFRFGPGGMDSFDGTEGIWGSVQSLFTQYGERQGRHLGVRDPGVDLIFDARSATERTTSRVHLQERRGAFLSCYLLNERVRPIAISPRPAGWVHESGAQSILLPDHPVMRRMTEGPAQTNLNSNSPLVQLETSRISPAPPRFLARLNRIANSGEQLMGGLSLGGAGIAALHEGIPNVIHGQTVSQQLNGAATTTAGAFLGTGGAGITITAAGTALGSTTLAGAGGTVLAAAPPVAACVATATVAYVGTRAVDDVVDGWISRGIAVGGTAVWESTTGLCSSVWNWGNYFDYSLTRETVRGRAQERR